MYGTVFDQKEECKLCATGNDIHALEHRLEGNN